jgi:GDP-L-fucose synthase
MDITNKRVLITGGSGFLGRHIVEAFDKEGAETTVLRSRDRDMTELGQVNQAFTEHRPEIVVHAAADVGGIGYNRLYPADIFRNNLIMTTNVFQAAKEARIEKLVIIGSACAYPGEVDGLMAEDDFLDGPLHDSVECYGFSKRALFIGAKAFREQYGLNSIFLILTNLYGPWDKFDPRESHVVAALIRKFVEAKANGDPQVECWGTGKPIREFLYVEDCAEAVVRATQVYDKPDPLNMGTGTGTSIRELSEVIPEVVGYTGQVVWDASKPDGAMRKVLDVTKMKAELGWEPRISLRDGLRKTIDWFVENEMVAAV